MLTKTFKLLTVILLFACKVNAQFTAAASLPTTLPFTSDVDSVFRNLDKSFITTGILYDRIYPFAALHVFNTSLADTSFKEHFRQGYYEIFKAAYDKTGLTSPDSIDKRADRIEKTGNVPIGIFNFRFNQMDTNALANNLISETNGLYYDVAGRSKSPYWLKTISVISPLLDSAYGLQVTFQTATNLIFKNIAHSISSLQADFGNGSGLITIGTNNTTTVNYSTYGVKVIKFIITYNDNTQRTTYSKFKVVQTASRPFSALGTTCDKLDNFFAETAFTDYDNNTFKGKGEIYYYFATNTTCNGKVRKPIIILDGYDPQDKRSYQELYDEYLNNSSRYKFADELRSKGFDIVVLNFPKYTNSLGKEIDGGTDYIERNAFVLVTLINKLRQELIDNVSAEKITIVGPSMGGLISRYALAYMEKNNIPHNTSLWISFDAPHNGANISIGAQKFLEFFAGNGNRGARDAVNQQLLNPAAQQLLLHHYTSNSALAQGAPNYRDRFVQALTSNGVAGSNGFPTIPRKVSIADGSLNGTLQSGVGACQKALDMTSYFTFKYLFLFKIHLFKGAAASVYFAGSYGNSCTVFNGNQLFKGSTSSNGSAPTSSVSYDVAPGATFNTLQVLANEAGYSPFGIGYQVLLNILINNIFIGGYGTDTKFNVFKDSHCFIPTKSALAFKGTNQDLAENLYERNLVCTGETPFNTYYGGLTNLEHVYITPEIAHFAIDEITGIKRQPTFQNSISSLYISGPDRFCTSGNYSLIGATLPSGTSITWNSGSIAGIGSGQGTTQVRLDRISNGTATLTAALTKTCSINQTVTKTYATGGFTSADYGISGPSGSCPNATVDYYISTSLAGATGYTWTWPGDWTYMSGQGTTHLTLRTGANSGYVELQVSPTCNQTSPPASKFVGIYSCLASEYSVSPNPATSEVTVAVAQPSQKDNSTAITKLNIYDQQGNLKKHQNFNKVKRARMNVADLPAGVYFIEIVNGTTKERHQLSILK
jgi:hypothetical protein